MDQTHSTSVMAQQQTTTMTPAPQFYHLWNAAGHGHPPQAPLPQNLYQHQLLQHPGLIDGPFQPAPPPPPLWTPLSHYLAFMSTTMSSSFQMYMNFIRSIYASCQYFMSELFWSNVRTLMPYFSPPLMMRWLNKGVAPPQVQFQPQGPPSLPQPDPFQVYLPGVPPARRHNEV